MAQKTGSIANVSSACGYMGAVRLCGLFPAKFAVVGFRKSAPGLLPYNIDISVIFPPDTDNAAAS